MHSHFQSKNIQCCTKTHVWWIYVDGNSKTFWQKYSPVLHIVRKDWLNI